MAGFFVSRGGAATRRIVGHAETRRRGGGVFAAKPLSPSCGAFDAISEYWMTPSAQSDIFAPLRLCVHKILFPSASPRRRVNHLLEEVVQ